jgi:hypothetical protein
MPPIYRMSVTYTDSDNTVRVIEEVHENRDEIARLLMHHTVLPPDDIQAALDLVRRYDTKATSHHGERFISVEYVPESEQ